MKFYQKLLKSNSKPLVMGILNMTPDSFYDGGKHNSKKKSITHVKNMIKEGVDIIDIGACSTRPGAQEISLKEEEKRLFPTLEVIKDQFPNTIISIDTYRYQIAKKAIKYGAHIINDIYFEKETNKMINVILENNTPYILMHMQGAPSNMQNNIQYHNFKKEIISFFRNNTTLLNKRGVKNIILDPGFGFGKTLNQNYELINMIPTLKKLGYPLLTGTSHKSMIKKALKINNDHTLCGTITLNTLCLIKGASIIRVHDVLEAKQTVTLFNLLKENNT